MAYLHCHTCNWSQDDFWEWEWTWRVWKFRPFGYNPISLFVDNIHAYGVPRYIEFDISFAREHGLESPYIHSWRVLWWELKKSIRSVRDMKWWTWKSWRRHAEGAVCPQCKERNFDID